MKKQNSLAELFTIAAAGSEPDSPHHFLFFLGTDTIFTPKPTPIRTNYDRGETLSYSAQAIVSLLGEVAEIDVTGEPLSYCSPSVDVLNGPTTLGAEVGHRVAQGVFLALRAAATGKKTLQISAHSRGAVEAILVMHELGRIKKELAESPEKTLRQILLDSPSTQTTSVGMLALFPQQDNDDKEENRRKLLHNLNVLEINPFLIDPVPGDTVYFIPGFTWHDPLFYEQPPCNSYELLLYRDERSGCFYPIVPKGMQPTIIPGHHGTGSGNHYSQQLEEPPGLLKKYNTKGVQDLVLCKLFNFLHKATNLFGQTNDRQIPRVLGNTDLNDVLATYLSTDMLSREKSLIARYVEVYENDQAYRHYTLTTYKDYFLGRALASDGHRYIHYHSPDYASMAILSTERYGNFVNIEHAMLHLNDCVDFSNAQTEDADIQVMAIHLTLENIIRDMLQDATGNHPHSKLLSIFEKKDGRENFFNCLSIIVDSISQKYLRNHLSTEEKSKLMAVIKQPFATLSAASKDIKISQFDHAQVIGQCKDILQNGLKQTIKTHCNAILQQSNQIHQHIQLFLAPPECFITTWDEFLSGLTSENHEINQKISVIKARLSQLNPINIEASQKALSIEINKINKSEEFNPTTKNELLSFFFHKNSIPLQAHVEAYKYSIEQHLFKIEQIFDAATSLFHAHQELNCLVGEQGLEIDPGELSIHRNALIVLAGALLKEKNYDLRIIPHTVSAEFYNLAKNQAVALGAPSPDIEVLKNIASTQTAKIREMTIKIDNFTGVIDEQDAKLSIMQKTMEKTIIEHAKLKNQIKKLNTEKEATCNLLIHQKLGPLTTTYLNHLLIQANKYIPELDKNNYDQTLPASNTMTHTTAKKEAYNKIKTKYDAVQNLYHQLTTTDEVIPSQRLMNFSHTLQGCEADLKLHRDPFWKAYFKSCIAVITIIATGIIPGILYLATYSNISGRSPLFFSQSNGEQYVEDILSYSLEAGLCTNHGNAGSP